MDWIEAERQKYLAVWDYPWYRERSDGERCAKLAYDSMGCEPGETLIDWGCGCGRPAKRLEELGLKVVGFDIASNCLDKGLDIPFVQGCLWSPPEELHSHYAFSTDVLEHIPPVHVDETLDVMFRRTKKAAFIQVCVLPDTSGKKMDPPQVLHLTVQPKEWWLAKLEARWQYVEVKPDGKARVRFVCWR